MLPYIIAASVKLPPEKFQTNKEQSGGASDMEYKSVVLNSADELFADLRDRNFSAVGEAVSRKALIITAQFDVRAYLNLFPHVDAF